MIDFRQILVSPDCDIQNAVEAIDRGKIQIALVVDKTQRLLGTVTDGDVRRGLLNYKTTRILLNLGSLLRETNT